MEARFKREISVLDQIFHTLDDFIETAHIDERTALGARLTVEELFTNLVRHNRGGSDYITIRVEIEGGKLVIGLEDYEVEPVKMADFKPADLGAPLYERREGGLGIHLVRNFVDELTYDYEQGTLHIKAVINLEERDVRH